MKPVVHFELTGKAIVTVLAFLAITALVLAGVWFVVNPGWAIAGGIAVVLVIRGVIALFSPAE